jgi:PAS domain S-box-containing protein
MSSRERILVVDDDEAVALLHQRILERAGYAVSAANSVQGAVAVLQDVVADLIVTDYRLSETSTGLDLHTQLRELGCDIPVILVTGFSDEQTAISALRQGVRDLVPKTAAYLDYLPSAVERVLRQVRTERQLAQSESRFELFMDYSPAIAFIKDEQGRLLYANRGFEEACGNTSWRDKTDSELWPQPTAQQLRDHDEAVLAAGAPQQFNESLVHWDGTRRHWLTIRFPLPEADGRRLLGGMSLDVTQQKLAEEALRERDEQLRRSQKLESLGTLAGGVAHEFNNLLQAILEYTRFAMQAIPAHQPSYRDLEVVVKVAERASLLTKQLLGFSRRDTAQPADIDPNELVQDLVKLLRPLLGEHITVELALSDDVHCIYVDPGQIQQVLMNICINACDAMPSGGTLYISTCVLAIDDVSQVPSPDLNTGQYVVPSVRDTGSGMTPEVRERIFEPFFTTKEVGKGTGLGLAMVYGIVQQHRGAIHVESEINQGSTFTIYLPAAAAASAGKEIAASQPGHGERGTILVVEDEQLVLDLILRMLQELGYHTLTARDGCQAIEVFREHTAEIDLVLLDAVMPRMSGREACCRIKAIRPEVPVVFCTGYDRQGPSEELMPGGGNASFAKASQPHEAAGSGASVHRRAQACQRERSMSVHPAAGRCWWSTMKRPSASSSFAG